MRTVPTRSMNDPTLTRRCPAALLMAAALLVIPTPVAAASRTESPGLHTVSPAVHGLLARPRHPDATPRLGPPGKETKPVGRRDPTNRQLRRLPQSRTPGTRREAMLARRLLLARLPVPARPQKPRLFDSWQIRAIDGDTFAIGTERFRIRGLNAPERTEAGGFGAAQRLDFLLHQGPVLVIPYGSDAYGRTLAEVYVNNRNLADVMREEGYDTRR